MTLFKSALYIVAMKKLFLTLLFLVVSSNSFAIKDIIRFGGRKFIFVTQKSFPKNKPLLVLLHGCTQSADIILDGTELEKIALKKNFLILAPEQSFYYNFSHCWNWFFPYQQARTIFNEMGEIIFAIDTLKSVGAVNPDKIYVAGLSAGGVLTHSLAVCYPDYFKAVVVHSGLAYKTAESAQEAQKVLLSENQKDPEYQGKAAFECGNESNYQRRKLEKVMIIHGEEDTRVAPLHAHHISKVDEVLVDYMDDFKRNYSVRFFENIETEVFPNNYFVKKYSKTFSNGFIEQKIMVKGLSHAWGGVPASTRNFDPLAPSSNNFILEFFDL